VDAVLLWPEDGKIPLSVGLVYDIGSSLKATRVMVDVGISQFFVNS
jgi:hypothetical protein